MGNFDDHPPKHLTPSEMRDDKNWNIHKQGKLNLDGPSFVDWLLGRHRRVYLTCEELRVLILHGERPVMCHGNKMSRKAYKKALEQQHKARIWIEEEKQAKAQQASKDLME